MVFIARVTPASIQQLPAGTLAVRAWGVALLEMGRFAIIPNGLGNLRIHRAEHEAQHC
jgi:hypothetical protein